MTIEQLLDHLEIEIIPFRNAKNKNFFTVHNKLVVSDLTFYREEGYDEAKESQFSNSSFYLGLGPRGMECAEMFRFSPLFNC